MKLSPELILIEVQKGLIIEVKRENSEELHIKVRQAEENERQQRIDGHWGYDMGETRGYYF